MSQLADQLADLTAFRDRDVLDVSLVSALRDLLQPDLVAIYRCVGEPASQRWLTRARLAATDAVATSDPPWCELDSLPRAEEHPLRWQAFCSGQVCIREVAGRHMGYFPVANDHEVTSVIEVCTLAPLDTQAHRLVSSVLRIFSNFQGLLEYSERDTLTGLLNRKTFDGSFLKASADGLLSRTTEGDVRRQGVVPGSCWLGVIDIDHFKRVNDNFGHLIGDEVLLLLSRLMRAGFRFHDRLYRFGGEEFVVLMRCESAAIARASFERFRSTVAAYDFPQVGRITISIGLAEVRHGDSSSAAFERADKAVYFAKANGRNQVCEHAELLARGELSDASKVGDVELF
jgi:diguanylate cyclase (GGDEF)-like protein